MIGRERTVRIRRLWERPVRSAQNHWQQHRVASWFLLFAAFFGLAFVFLTPPTQAADETTHFYRAYEFSQGEVFARPVEQGYGAVLPAQVYTVSRQMFADIPSHYERKFNYRQVPHLLRQRIDFSKRIPVHLEGATVYSPAGYVPQVLGIMLAKLVWPSVPLMYYFGRIFNLVLWTALVYCAIRLWPGNKWSLFALALIPMSMSQAATLSPDATINSLTFLTISAMFYFAHRRTPLAVREIILLTAAVVILSLCKPVLFVIGLLPLILNRTQLGAAKWRYGLVLVGIFAAGVLATGLWNVRVEHYSTGIQHYYYNNVPIDAVQQIKASLTHPWHFGRVLADTYLTSNGNVIAMTFISRLGWWDVDAPVWFIVINYALLFAAIMCVEKRIHFTRREKIVAAAVFALGFLAISSVLYVTISAVGAPTITGVQGRYFIAFTPLLAVVAGGLLRVRDWNKIAERLFPIGYAALLSTSLIIMVSRFT